MVRRGAHGRGYRGGPLPAVIAAISASLALAAPALAAPGDLDPAFSGDGKATIDFGGDEAGYIHGDSALAPNGDVIVVGATGNVLHPLDAQMAFAVAALRPDGTPDPAFGGGDGQVVFERGVDARATSVAIQPDGKIVVGGFDVLDGGVKKFMDVFRLNADGTPDSTFGSGGFQSVDFGVNREEAYDVVVQPDGAVVLAGLATGANLDYAVARFTPGGQPDGTFSGDGKATFGGAGNEGGFAAALQPDGKLVVAGQSGVDTSAIRITTAGAVDATFGTGGETSIPVATQSFAEAVAIQPDGAVVMVGNGNEDIEVVRLGSSGTPDATFGNGGIRTIDLGGTYDVGEGVAIAPDGKIIVGGNGGAPASRLLTAIRLTPSGLPDTTFGEGDGVAAFDFASNSQYGGDVSLQPDGKIILGGITYNNDDMAIARLDGDPTADTAPPQTKITKQPKGKTHKSKAKYRFKSSEPGSTFECSFDSKKKKFKPCDAGKVKYKHLDLGKHVFLVRATDPAGNTDASPAKDKFKRK